MKVSLNWLKRYIDLNASINELEEVFPSLGFEVESIEHTGMPPLNHVVVGEVLSREQHPDADKLGVCQVKVGPEGEPIRQIVCGASNYKVGDKIPVALEGACLPGDFKIKKSKLRGVPSEGMMCAAQELGLPDDTPGLWILDPSIEVGTPINDLFKNNDVVFDLELTANRGDCASHIGIARELSAYYKLPLKLPEVKTSDFSQNKNALVDTLKVETPGCPMYLLHTVKGVKVGPSPDWLKKDLEAVGLRPINNIVDITNWVMMETGQPLHAFDAAKLEGKTIIVRQAKEGEKITTLDEKERVLSSEDMVIADASKPVAIAGVMGNFTSGVSHATADIVLESAYFNRSPIRKTSRRHNLSTDSSYRFARDVDPQGVTYAAQLAVKHIVEIAGGSVALEHTYGEAPRKDQVIEVTGDYIRAIGGYGPADNEIKAIFEGLGFLVKEASGKMSVTVPTFRADVHRPIDLAEECLRMYGPSKIPSVGVKVPGLSRADDPLAVFNHKASDYLMSQGFGECYHYSLRSGKDLEALYGSEKATQLSLHNPLTAEHTHVRPSLIPGLLDALLLNQDNGNAPRRLFEVGRVYHAGGGKSSGMREMAAIAFVIVLEPGIRTWLSREPADYFTAKSIALTLGELTGLKMKPDALNFDSIEESTLWQKAQSGKAGDLMHGYGIEAGLVDVKVTKEWGINSPVLAGEIVVGIENFRNQPKRSKFKEFSNFPASTKDIALVVNDGLKAEDVRGELERAAKKVVGEAFLVEDVSIFDVYQGKGLTEGKKSLAFSLKFRGQDRTLKDKEVNTAFEAIQKQITEDTSLGYEVRA